MWMDKESVIQRGESERKKQILNINIYMWDREKWYRSPHLHSTNEDTDIENKCMDTKGEKVKVGGIGILGLTHTHY